VPDQFCSYLQPGHGTGRGNVAPRSGANGKLTGACFLASCAVVGSARPIKNLNSFFAIEYFLSRMKTYFFSVMMAIIPCCFKVCDDAFIRHASLRV
jgi:hypothetical protein